MQRYNTNLSLLFGLVCPITPSNILAAIQPLLINEASGVEHIKSETFFPYPTSPCTCFASAISIMLEVGICARKLVCDSSNNNSQKRHSNSFWQF